MWLKANKDVIRSEFCREQWMCLQRDKKEGEHRVQWNNRSPRGRQKAKDGGGVTGDRGCQFMKHRSMFTVRKS